MKKKYVPKVSQFYKYCYFVGKDNKDGKLRCRCKKYHLYWPDDGICYREYKQGPCPEGHRYENK